jgi:hypothetical protein
VFVYNGSIMPGHHNGKALDITSVFEAVGAHAAGTIDDAELLAIEEKACPGELPPTPPQPDQAQARRSGRIAAAAAKFRLTFGRVAV